MGRLGQLHASVGLAFLVAAASMTACGSTDTPDAEPAAPTSTTAPTTTGETEALVVDAAAASLPATTIQTTDSSSLGQLCDAILSWILARGMLSMGPTFDIMDDIIERDETIDIEELNEQLSERLESTTVQVEVTPDAYLAALIEILSLVGGAMDGSLPDELQEFAEAFSQFLGERVSTFGPGSPTVYLSSLSVDDLPNADAVLEECGLQEWDNSG